MKSLKTYLKRYRILIVCVAVVVGGAFVYKSFFATDTATTDTFAVVETVEKGTVASGIQTSGTIVAAQKLDLDVYKQARRIEAVNVSNATHVDAGTVLFSFDKSGAYVEVKSASVQIAEAELALSTEKAKYGDANTKLRTLQNTLVTLQTAIVQAEKDIVQAKRDFLNANKSAEPGDSDTKNKTRPIISGLYSGDAQGTYTIEVYGSAAPSGYSYRVTGLEADGESVIYGIATPLGSHGLKIQFSNDIKHGDTWTVAIANSAASEYVENKENYEAKVRQLQDTIASKKTEIANTEIEIKNESQTDSSSYRNLDIAKAEAALSAARQKQTENYDVVQEQDIVAPFAGTVEGLENVVVGATPTGNTNDTISLGTLISDEFLVNFSLSATDVAKVTVGQKVLVTVTSFPGALPLEASVKEVSSLPESDGVAQYKVQALITIPENTTFKLREGLLASVEVVQTELTDVIRVPLSALTFQNGQATVQVIGDLTAEQKTELENMGVIKSVAGTFPSYAVKVEVGVSGTFYAEIKSGLTAGMQIIVTKTESDSKVVEQTNFGPGGDGEGRPRESNSGGSTSAAPAN